jgi:Txe/YoeB family toxin of Txe-Axe toxin-antitoxin module
MAEEIVEIRNSDKSDGYKKDAELEVYRDYKRRFDNLRKDFERDEQDRMQSLLYSLQYYFSGRKEQVHEFVYNVAEGEISDVIKQYPKWIQQQNTLECPF